MADTETPAKTLLSTPAAILVGSVIIAAAIVFTNLYGPAQRRDAEAGSPPPIDEKNMVMAPVTDADHIYGSSRAAVFLVEYADTECPFCRTMHPILKRVVDDSNGQVAWVYRHFPLDSLHPTARLSAQAAECAAQIGGKDSFWQFLNALYTAKPAVDRDVAKELPAIAARLGLDRKRFRSCLSSGTHEARVEANYQDGVKIGITGTPTTILVSASGEKKALVGAQPAQAVQAAIGKLSR